MPFAQAQILTDVIDADTMHLIVTAVLRQQQYPVGNMALQEATLCQRPRLVATNVIPAMIVVHGDACEEFCVGFALEDGAIADHHHEGAGKKAEEKCSKDVSHAEFECHDFRSILGAVQVTFGLAVAAVQAFKAGENCYCVA